MPHSPQLRLPLRSSAACLIGVFALAAGTTGAAATDTRTYQGVTQAIFDCVKTTSEAQHGTVYASAGGLTGTATTASSLYTVRMGFVFDPAGGSLAYTLVSKSFIVPTSAVWSGIETAITGCR